MPDFSGDAGAIAGYFGAIAAPAGEPAIAEATSTPPQAPAALPAVYVYVESGEFETGNGSRAGVVNYRARFLLCEAADEPSEVARLLLWLPKLTDALKAHVQLGGRVARAVVAGFDVGLISYAGKEHAGIDLDVLVTTSEGWVATA